MYKIISVILITVVNTTLNYGMETPEIGLLSLPFKQLYAKYAIEIGQNHCSTQKEFYNTLLPCIDTPEIRSAMISTLTNQHTPKNCLTNEQILVSILKKNNVPDTNIEKIVLKYRDSLDKK